MENRHRKSIRLPGYDYSQNNSYFVTICTQGRKNLFGEIKNGELVLNEVGKMIKESWLAIPQFYLGAMLDEFVVMPNHFHGIILIVGADPCVCPGLGQSRGIAPTKSRVSLPIIIQRFKSFMANKYLKENKKPLWQRNYYEHIIRGEKSLDKIRNYIKANPTTWGNDVENSQSQELAVNKYYKNIFSVI
ncbi:MAG: transposase [Candidatus Buchananbacteria bacterium]